MNDTAVNSDQWNACTDGELASLERKPRAQRRVRSAARIVVGTTGALLLVILSGGLVAHQLRGFNDVRFGNISCTDVKANLHDYSAGRLDEHRADQIRAHLAEYPGCAAIHQDLIGEVHVPVQMGRTELGPLPEK